MQQYQAHLRKTSSKMLPPKYHDMVCMCARPLHYCSNKLYSYNYQLLILIVPSNSYNEGLCVSMLATVMSETLTS